MGPRCAGGTEQGGYTEAVSPRTKGPAATGPVEGLLDTIRGPQDLRGLSDAELAVPGRGRSATSWSRRSPAPAATSARTSAWSSSRSPCTGCSTRPRDPILFDTGHQAYVHKIVTGRQAGFDALRQRGGLSGYPSRAESEHDWIENSHASTALSYADGLAKAFALRGERRHVVAVVGDGALTGGMCWEALNNIAAAEQPAGHRGQRQRPLLRPDHRRAGRPPGRAAAQPGLREGARPGQGRAGPHPAGRRARCTRRCTRSRRASRTRSPRRPCSRTSASSTSARSTGTTSRRWRRALRRARGFGGPVIVHAVTRKGVRATRRPRTTRPTRCTARRRPSTR